MYPDNEPLLQEDIASSGEASRSDDHHGHLERELEDSIGVKRSLQQRHLSMIALAGMIGTGLFLSSGRALAQAGPLGCVLAFIIMGTVTASIAYTCAEMSAFLPVSGGFVRHASLWVNGALGAAVGWNFWYAMAATMPTEISAATTLLKFWDLNIHPAVPISIFWAIIAGINFAPVFLYGEFEFYFALCKLALIIGFLLGGTALDVGAFGNGREAIGFRYWRDPYPLFREYILPGLSGRFIGFWSAMLSAAFAFGNVQVVALAGAETQNPRKAIPNALKRTFARVVLFYVASIFVIALLVPADDERLNIETGDVNQSPFVIAFSRAGVQAFPSLTNAIIITSAFSSGNSCTFLASRTLHGLALDGNAPAAFLRVNRFGIPYVAVAFSVIWGTIAYLSLNHGAYQVFVWLVSLVTTSGIISWVVIGVTYLRFYGALKAQNISRERLPYKSPGQPYITYYALVMNVLILILSGWNSFIPYFNLSTFVSSYLNCLLFPLVYYACKRHFKADTIPLEKFDFKKDLQRLEYLETPADDLPPNARPQSEYDRILNALF